MREGDNECREADEIVDEVLKHLAREYHFHKVIARAHKTDQTPVDTANHEQNKRNNV